MFDEAIQKLQQPGAIGVIPTDTIYGVVARASDQAAVSRLYRLKKRDHKTGTLITADIEQLVKLGFKRRYLKAVERFWPGAVSVETPCGPELTYLHLGLNRVAVRIPDNQPLQKLLIACGPLLTSSANAPDEPHANTVTEAQAYFGDKVDFYIDGGDLTGRPPSTILRIIDDAIEVVRQGAVPIDEETGRYLGGNQPTQA
jgi:L-threonylcarbamoyladenylate synthase